VKKKPNLLLMVAIAIFMVVVVFKIAESSGPDVEVETTVDTVLTGGDNIASIAGSRSYGVSQSLGDVDINDCLASTQWGIPVIFAKQTVQENPWCMANSLDARGAHAAAAKVRCTTETIKAIYPDPKECEKAVMFQMKHIEKPAKVDRDDDRYEALYARMAAYEEQISKAEDNTRKVTQRANAAAVVAKQQKELEQQTAQQDLETYREIISE